MTDIDNLIAALSLDADDLGSSKTDFDYMLTTMHEAAAALADLDERYRNLLASYERILAEAERLRGTVEWWEQNGPFRP